MDLVILFRRRVRRIGILLWAFHFLIAVSRAGEEGTAPHWVGTWATAPIAEAAATDQASLAGATLRQIVHLSIGGSGLRIKIANTFGATPLFLLGVHVAVAGARGSIQAQTDRRVLFNRGPSIAIPPGAAFLSDPLDFPLDALSDLAVSIYLQDVPATLTVHPGARATSYLQSGDALAVPAMPEEATTFTRWYFLTGIDVLAPASTSAIVILGDSITDGYGCITDQNNRWTDVLAGRLQEWPDAPRIGVLNEGIGGNRLLRDGLGPSALARFDHDVLAQAGARWLIVFEGINDIGTRLDARKRGVAYASAAEIVGAYQQIAARAKTHGLRVIGATITPYAGADFYWSVDGEADRATVNRWIRTSGTFDAVIDFDAALHDPENPTHLAKSFDSGDHLHPSLSGYRRMAEIVDLRQFHR